MSLKAIEMQVSVPRSQSVGKIQDQLQQRGQVVQDHIALEQNKDDEKKRKQVLEASESEKKRLNNDDESQNGNGSRSSHDGKKGKKEDKDLNVARHPYKGNFVDFSG